MSSDTSTIRLGLQTLQGLWSQRHPARAHGGTAALRGFSFQITCFLLRFFETVEAEVEEAPPIFAQMEGLADFVIDDGRTVHLTQVVGSLMKNNLHRYLLEYYEIIDICRRDVPEILHHLRFQIMCRNRSTLTNVFDVQPDDISDLSSERQLDQDSWNAMLAAFAPNAPIVIGVDIRTHVLDYLLRMGIHNPNEVLRASMGYVLEHFGPNGDLERPQELASRLREYYYQAKRAALGFRSPVLVITEGKTDWKHLKAALTKLQRKGKYKHLYIEFHEYGDTLEMGESELLKMCESLSKYPRAQPTICIFDRDQASTVKKVSDESGSYRDWGNKVISVALPIPHHRESTPEVCIELYYLDDEITREDELGRRLYLSSEFHRESGRHLKMKLNCTDLNKIRRKAISIVDAHVYDEHDRNVALPKSRFAELILSETPPFDSLDPAPFEPVFDSITKIVSTFELIGTQSRVLGDTDDVRVD